MIVTTTETVIERNNTTEEKMFTIKGTASAFKILSSGLYSNKILAVVRELACNAYDAHTAAGNNTTPIEVKLPSPLNPTFYVKDYGTGLSHEQVLDLYTAYFNSTKTDSNDFIGALGLGSKSPFSYASEFTVESRFNGERRTYACFINENGFPSITLLNTHTDEDAPNGLTILLAVEQNDINKFHNAAKTAFMYFNVQPNIVGIPDFTPYIMEYSIGGANWKIRKPVNGIGTIYSGARVVQGLVSYPIDRHMLTPRGMTSLAENIAKLDIDIFVPIGDVDVAASREALSYDPRTITNLLEIFEQIADEFWGTHQDKFDACATKWEAAVLHNTLTAYSNNSPMSTIYNLLNKKQPFTWSNTEVSQLGNYDLTGIDHTSVHVYALNRYNKLSTKHYQWHPKSLKTNGHLLDVKASDDIHVMIDTKARGTTYIYREHLRTLPHGASLLVIKPSNRKGVAPTYNTTEGEFILGVLGNPTYINAADLDYQKPTSGYSRSYVSTGPRKRKTERLKYIGFDNGNKYARSTISPGSYTKKIWDRVNVEELEGGYYITVDKYATMAPSGRSVVLDTLLSDAVKIGLIPNEPDVYGFSANELDEIIDDENWINIIDYLTDRFEELRNTTIRHSYNHWVYINSTGYRLLHELTTKWDKYDAKLPAGMFKNYINTITPYVKPVPTTIRDTNYVGMQLDLTVLDQDHLDEAWAAVVTHYPMLSVITNFSTAVEHINVVLEYINMVDKKTVELSVAA